MPKLVVGLGVLLCFPALFIAPRQKDVETLAAMVICASFLFSRYLVLALLHVRGFYALFLGYFSAGYAVLFLLALLLIDGCLPWLSARHRRGDRGLS